MPTDIGDFLQARRARVAPESRGLPGGERRRVPGLRREELAMLAGVSTDYYVRLEQGRADSVSDAVLASIADVLALDRAERAHLHLLARPPRDSGALDQVEARDGLTALIAGLTELPAFLIGRRQRVLDANPLGRAILPDWLHEGAESSLTRLMLDPQSREYYVDWQDVARESVAYLRGESGRHPGDPRLAQLIGDLDSASTEFRQFWAAQDVDIQTHGVRRLNHPTVGRIDVNWETLTVPDTADLYVIVYTPLTETDRKTLRSLI